jgi:MFS family permease
VTVGFSIAWPPTVLSSGERMHSPTSAQAGRSEAPWPRAPYAWAIALLLMTAFTMSYIDRQVLSLLVTPMKASLHISDTQVSVLQGLAFGLFYAVMGLPLGRLADHYNRRNLIVAGIVAWCLMTCLCGLASTYWQLLAARLGVGIGEATLGPAAYSIMADYFPANKLPRVIGVYTMGAYFGIALAYMLGGFIVALATAAPPIVLPWFGVLAAWQVTFIAIGAPGLIVAALLLAIREPMRRRGVREITESIDLIPGWTEVFRYALKNWRVYLPLFGGFTLVTLSAYAIVAWTPTLFVRKFGWKTSEIGLAYGLIIFVFASSASAVGGHFAARLFALARPDRAIRMAFWSYAILTPFAIAVPLAPTPVVTLLLLVVATIAMTWPAAIVPSTVLTLTPNRMRAQISAMYSLMQTIGGLALAPTCVALLTDYVFRSERALPLSLACVALVATPLGAAAIWYSQYAVRAAMKALPAERLRTAGVQ